MLPKKKFDNIFGRRAEKAQFHINVTSYSCVEMKSKILFEVEHMESELFLNDELWSDWCFVTIMWCSITCIASKSQEFMRLLYWNILHVNFLCSFYVVLMYFFCQTFLVIERQPLLRTMICIGEHEVNLTDTNFKSISINFYDELIWLIAHV